MGPVSRSGPSIALPGYPLIAAVVVLIPLLFSLPGKRFTADDYWFAGYGNTPAPRPAAACTLLQSFAGDWLTGARGTGGWLRPVPRIAWWMDDVLFGIDRPWGYHLTNIVLHALNVAMVAILAQVLLAGGALARRREAWVAEGPAPVIAGILFGLFPPSAGAVSWVSGRTDLLATGFTLATLLACASSIQTGRRLALVGIATALAGLSKETGFLTPAYVSVILLVQWASDRATPRGALVQPLIVSAGTAAAVLAWRTFVLGGRGGYPEQLHGLSIGSAGTWMGRYLTEISCPEPFLQESIVTPLMAGLLGFLVIHSALRRERVTRAAGLVVAGVAFAALAAAPIFHLKFDRVEDGRFLYGAAMGVAFAWAGIVAAADALHRAWRALLRIVAFLLVLSFGLRFIDYDERWGAASRRCDEIVAELVAAAKGNSSLPMVIAAERMNFSDYLRCDLQALDGAKVLPWDQAKWALYRRTLGEFRADWGLRSAHHDKESLLVLLGNDRGSATVGYRAMAKRTRVEDSYDRISPLRRFTRDAVEQQGLRYVLVELRSAPGAGRPGWLDLRRGSIEPLEIERSADQVVYLYTVGVIRGSELDGFTAALDSFRVAGTYDVKTILFQLQPVP